MSSPYLKNKNRLADVIAAIQVLGTYKYYKLSVQGWIKRIVGDNEEEDATENAKEEDIEYWTNVFKEHPEFFRFSSDGKRVSLVWRRSYSKNYDIDKGEVLPFDKIKDLKRNNNERYKNRISRQPLSNVDIKTLIDTAISIHTRDLEYKKRNQVWISATFAFSGAILGALAKGLLELI